MSGFSVSDRFGSAPSFFLIFCSPALATRQSATAAAKMPISAGSASSTAASMSRALSTCTVVTPGGIGQVDRAGDQRHARAGLCRGFRDGVALLAGGAVGDVAHRIDGLVRRPGRDDHMLAGKRSRRRQQALDGRRDLQRLGHAAGAELGLRHRALVGADHVHAVGLQDVRDCAASPDAATCARSWPARSGSAGSWRAAPSRRDRPHARPPSSP